MVPVVIFAALLRLVAVVAVPVTSPVKAPENVVAVTTPEALRLVAPMVPTVILGVPERPVALPVTLPVRAPENVVAVTTPVTVTPEELIVTPVPTLT